MNSESTDKKIINAFTELLLKKGYKEATTMAIAQRAGVNESTLFRHFKDKRGLLTALVKKYLSDADRIGDFYQNSDDLFRDLTQIAGRYQNFINDHRAILMVGLRESLDYPEVNQVVEAIPERFKAIVIDDLSEAQKRGFFKENIDIEVIAANFIWLNFGYFLSRQQKRSVSLNTFLDKNIRSFIKEII